MNRMLPVRLIVTTMAVLGLGWAARAPYRAASPETGLLRLSWRLVGGTWEICRKRSHEELEKLPVHMRSPEVCERLVVSYRLIVQIDDRPADTTRILPRGAHGDRPLFVFKEAGLAPGPHRIRVSFAPERTAHELEEERERAQERRRDEERDKERDEERDRARDEERDREHERERDEHSDRDRDRSDDDHRARSARRQRILTIDTRVEARAGRIELITLEPGGRQLTHYTSR